MTLCTIGILLCLHTSFHCELVYDETLYMKSAAPRKQRELQGLKEHSRACQANMANPYEYVIFLALNY